MKKEDVAIKRLVVKRGIKMERCSYELSFTKLFKDTKRRYKNKPMGERKVISDERWNECCKQLFIWD